MPTMYSFKMLKEGGARADGADGSVLSGSKSIFGIFIYTTIEGEDLFLLESL